MLPVLYKTLKEKRQVIRKEVSRLLEEDNIQPSFSISSWSSHFAIVNQKGGTPIVCIDYRSLNSVTKKDANPLSVLSDCLAELGRNN